MSSNISFDVSCWSMQGDMGKRNGSMRDLIGFLYDIECSLLSKQCLMYPVELNVQLLVFHMKPFVPWRLHFFPSLVVWGD